MKLFLTHMFLSCKCILKAPGHHFAAIGRIRFNFLIKYHHIKTTIPQEQSNLTLIKMVQGNKHSGFPVFQFHFSCPSFLQNGERAIISIISFMAGYISIVASAHCSMYVNFLNNLIPKLYRIDNNYAYTKHHISSDSW